MSSLSKIRVLTARNPVWKQALVRHRLSNNATLRSFVNLPSRNVFPARASESPFNLMFRELEDFFPRTLPFAHSHLLNPFAEHFQPRALGSNESGRFATPRFEITEDDNEFKLAVDVPGVKPKDMKIKLEQDGRVLRLTGERKIQDGNWTSEMTFEKAFLLDKKVETDKITANLSDGVVVITAPKVLSEQKNIIEIPITEVTHASIPSGEEAENEINISTGKK
jgi:HSP20 family molecular chaperone IbpA